MRAEPIALRQKSVWVLGDGERLESSSEGVDGRLV
jgi:hypothetical protein